jgi:hypothetical protein
MDSLRELNVVVVEAVDCALEILVRSSRFIKPTQYDYWNHIMKFKMNQMSNIFD